MASSLAIIIIYSILTHTVFGQNCSALSSYVQVTQPAALSKTLTSAQALFPPYNYYIEPTELVSLSQSDNICTGSITTNVTDKIVTIFPANGNCSYVSRIYAAEQKGAKAVLIVNEDPSSGAIATMLNDDPNTDIIPSIPARMIPYAQALSLFSLPYADDTIMVEFGCYDSTNVTSVLCVIDLSGDHWWMDGDYQLQAGVTANGHQVWSKDGYLLVMDEDLYLYLNDGDGQHAWYWAITEDPNMEDSDKIRAKCGTNNIDNPTDCVNWYTTNFYLTSEGTFSLNSKFGVSASLCAIPDNYLCIQSTQSSLGGLYGTYRQFNQYAPWWFREWVDCDTQSGYLTFKNFDEKGVFWLIDPFDLWYVAECVVTGYTSAEYDEYVAFHPEICKEWITLVDGSLDAGHKEADATMSITVDTCDAYDCAEYDTVPETACMGRNSIMHSFLEGDYQLTGVRGAKYNTSEYVRSDKLYYEGEHVPVYVWYYGELDDEFNWWVISTANLSSAMSNGAGSVYGWCASNTKSPTSCKSCWNFYFAADDSLHGSWHSDCKFSMEEGDCDTTEEDKSSYVWPDYLCVRNVWHTGNNGTLFYDGELDFNDLMGGYQVNKTLVESVGAPFWWKPPNDYNDNITYIYYDQFYGYWQIGQFINEDAVLFCMEGAGDYLPTHCSVWYDSKANILGNMFIYDEGCSSNDILRKTSGKKERDLGPILAVFILLGVIAVCIAGYFWWKHEDKKTTKGFSRPTEQQKRTTKRMGSADIELGDDMEGNLMKGTTKKGGFDMRPLAVDDDDDDDDDLTVDAQEHDVDDDEDRETDSDAGNQLLGDTDKGSGSHSDGPDLGLTS